jgi:hypothetical protein
MPLLLFASFAWSQAPESQPVPAQQNAANKAMTDAVAAGDGAAANHQYTRAIAFYDRAIAACSCSGSVELSPIYVARSNVLRRRAIAEHDAAVAAAGSDADAIDDLGRALIAAGQALPQDAQAHEGEDWYPAALEAQGDALSVLAKLMLTGNPAAARQLAESAAAKYESAASVLERYDAKRTIQGWCDPDKDEACPVNRDSVAAARFRAAMVLHDAGPTPDATLTPEAQQAFDEGIAAEQQGNYLLASQFFLSAEKLAPENAAIVYNLALAESRIPGRELRSMAWFEAFLATHANAANAEQVKAQIDALRQKVLDSIQSLEALARQLAGQYGDDAERAEATKQIDAIATNAAVPVSCAAGSLFAADDGYINTVDDMFTNHGAANDPWANTRLSAWSGWIDQNLNGPLFADFDNYLPAIANRDNAHDILAGVMDSIENIKLGLSNVESLAGSAAAMAATKGTLDEQLIGDANGGLQYYAQAVQLCPDAAPSLTGYFAKTARHDNENRAYYPALEQFDLALSFETSDIARAALDCGRASIYLAVENYDLAIRDFTQGLEKSPQGCATFWGGDNTVKGILTDRGWAYLESGQTDKALADFNRCIDGPLDEEADEAGCPYRRGITTFILGQYKQAIGDLGKSQDSDAVLLSYIARVRTGISPAIAKQQLLKTEPDLLHLQLDFGSDEDAVIWRDLLKFFPGDAAPPQSLLVAAQSTDENGCSLPVYLGEYELLHGNKRKAEQYFHQELAKSSACHAYTEFLIAGAELKWLSGVKPTPAALPAKSLNGQPKSGVKPPAAALPAGALNESIKNR